MQRFKAQRSRGIDGFGLFNGHHLVKAAEEARILRWLKKPQNQSDLLLFHHRWPTSTINVRQTAHPFSTKTYFGATEYILVHNGVINNADELFIEHQKLGIEYQSLLPDLTYNDSEALLWDFALTLEGKQPRLTAEGSMAIICIKLVEDKLHSLYFGRNYNPLHMDANKEYFLLGSQTHGPEIAQNTLYCRSYATKQIDTQDFRFPYSSYSWSKGYGYTGRTAYDAYGQPYEDPFDVPTHRISTDVPIVVSEHKNLPSGLQNAQGKELQPNSAEDVALSYLFIHNGVFSKAYWAMQQDYNVLESTLEPDDDTAADELQRLQRASFWIEDHPDYKDDLSVSKEWRKACQQLAMV